MEAAQPNKGKGCLEEALKRKERLNSLKRKRGATEKNTEHNDAELPKPKFRSYKPSDEGMEAFVLDPVQPGDVASKVQDQLESAKSEIVFDQLHVTSLAPRKPDWDLKRTIAKKLEKVERQTQKAIAELIRDRLKESSRVENLAAMVNMEAADNT